VQPPPGVEQSNDRDVMIVPRIDVSDL